MLLLPQHVAELGNKGKGGGSGLSLPGCQSGESREEKRRDQVP